MGIFLIITGIILFISNLLVLIGTKEDISIEERREDKSGLIAGLTYMIFPVGLFLAIKNRENNNRGWYIKFILFITIYYIIPLPIGLYLLWKSNTFNKRNKKKLTIVTIVMLLSSLMAYSGFMVCIISSAVEEQEKTEIGFQIECEEETYPKLYTIGKDNLNGYIDETGQVVIEPKYSLTLGFTEGLSFVMKDMQGFYIDTTGQEVITLPNGVVGREFTDGMAIIEGDNGKYGFINREGTVIVEPKYEGIQNFKNGYAPVKIDSKWGLMDKEGNIVIEPKYYYIAPANEDGIFPASVDGKLGYMNLKEEFVVEPKYDNVSEMINGYGIVQESNGTSLHKVIDIKGNEIRELQCDTISQYGGGMYVGTYDGKYGYITADGKIAKEFNYTNALKVEGGVAPVSNDGVTWTFINIDGSLAVPDYYTEVIFGFDGELAKVRDKEGNEVYINKQGEVVYKLEK